MSFYSKNLQNNLTYDKYNLKHNAVERIRAESDQKVTEERASLLQAGMQAADHIRRLEQSNYALRVQLEQMAPSSSVVSGTPRWGEGY